MSKKQSESYSPLLDQMFGGKERHGRVVDWAQVDRTLMGDLVATCTAIGCAVLFGFTRDRGAWSLTFYWDGLAPNKYGKKSETVYCNAEEMLESWVEEWVRNWSRIAEAASKA